MHPGDTGRQGKITRRRRKHLKTRGWRPAPPRTGGSGLAAARTRTYPPSWRQRHGRRRKMALNLKKRFAVAGAVLGASLFTLAVANAQLDPNTGAPGSPGI